MISQPSGFLFIGDPHISSITPGRRMDACFADTVLDKIDQARVIAKERNLQAVFTGDLFDRAKDSQLRMLHLLVKLLFAFDYTPICLVGNHDRAETTQLEGTAMGLVAATGALTLLTGEAPMPVDMTTGEVLLWGVPHGMPLPTELPPHPSSALNVMVTHHDLAFERAYPGAIAPPEIKNVPIAVNGHMHLARPPVTKGETVWHNPGNITRMSLDCKDQIPRVWAWYPEAPQVLEPVDLRYQPDILNMVGRQVDAQEGTGQPGEGSHSEFASLLREENRMESGRTDDAALLREDLAEILEVREVSTGAKQILASLLANYLPETPADAVLPIELREQ